MDNNEKLNELRVLTDADDSDAVLLSFLRQAGDVILNRMYPYLDDEALENAKVPRRFEGKQLTRAAFLLNKHGAEGETMHAENGIHRDYKNAHVPEEMLDDVLPQVGLPR